jgi:hypothetical protein
MILFLCISLSALYILCNTQIPTITKNVITSKYNQFRELNELVSTQYKSPQMIFYVSLSMILKMYRMAFFQYLNNSIEYINKKKIIVSYIINGVIYKFVVNKRKGPSDILMIIDENRSDVTDEILPFYGPNQNWHGETFKPEFWKKEHLIFKFNNGEKDIIFYKNDNINI